MMNTCCSSELKNSRAILVNEPLVIGLQSFNIRNGCALGVEVKFAENIVFGHNQFIFIINVILT